jgi:hypothetical protein
MKNTISILICTSIALLLSLIGCKKEQYSQFDDLNQLVPIQSDSAAGLWKTVILNAPDEMPLAAPSSSSSQDYIAELEEVKQIMSGLTPNKLQAIEYWSAGSVLRWNQILRNFVTKYNLPPAPNDNGIYPSPNADSTNANPFYYPYFPFANPPYASRAYAYTSVAQFDALIASWHYRMQYNRKAPYHADPSIIPLVPKTDLPSYPCEEAVVAGAAQEILLLLFPGEKAEINRLVEEAAFSRLWAGAAVRSDVEAGLSLGKAVASKAVTRAKTDGMKTAGGNSAYIDSLKLHAESLGFIAWKSQDSPARPAMLPAFGRIKPWLLTASDITAIRPPQPPTTNSAEFKAELAEVKTQADPNDREKMRIVHFWADGAGTATPPGHWNALAFEAIYLAQWSEVRTARSFALLNMALADAAIHCWETKYHYFYPRPSQMDPSIKTLTGLPNFPAYTSGHSTFSAAGAQLLGHLFPSKASSYDSMAEEASISRVYGGIHYPMDCEQGIIAGTKVGEFAVQRARTDGAE